MVDETQTKQDVRATLIRKAKFFLEDQTQAHVKRFDGFWNGTFVKQKAEDVFLFNERRMGLMLLFLDDVKDIESYQIKEEEVKSGN